ncbi:phage tail protein [Xenorhabdus szentirmaii]|uniref:phage tail protein n=1 Tax=Xenorhabdus szentirmaii TaxID=290112 RepID=UPI00198EBEF3|nr:MULTISPECIES: phage tail protein [unclassified Xenorhabdus]MBD2806925.1 tail fiber protein [Xenorhabdus sp. ZM]MBD2827188.1 tail fiber protein [Xenorhabdus sp. 5]
MQDKKLDASVSAESNLVIVTTPEYIKEAIKEHAASRNHPYATHVEPGLVTLSNETDSDSELTVATSKAVKRAYNLANAANQDANNANRNANTRLAKDQNGADIPDKMEFVKNIGLMDALARIKNTALLSENGWWKCGDTGLIIQWGIFGQQSDAYGTYIFPLPIKFPNKGLWALGYSSQALSYGEDTYSGSAELLDNANLKVTLDNHRPTACIAIGY